MAAQTCISDDGSTYASGSLNAAGTHRCRDGTWDKVKPLAPTVGTTETGRKPKPLVIMITEMEQIPTNPTNLSKEKK